MKSIRHRIKTLYKDLVRYLNHRNSPVIKTYYRLFWTPKPGSIAELLDRYSRNNTVRFLQIGANDGMERDPLLKFIRRDGWTGVLVEPQEDVFRKLEYLHSHSRGIKLVNAAVDHRSGETPFYRISFSNARWATGIASFRRDTLEKQIESGYVEACANAEGIPLPEHREDYIEEISVRCYALGDLIRQSGLEGIDLLQIDTEGFDFEIIKMIDFSLMKPTLISFEVSHLSREDTYRCFELLKGEGYRIYTWKRDALAYLEGSIKTVN